MDANLTLGHVHRHAPSRSGLGVEAALIDIAQDILLRGLHEAGVLDMLAFKGGTALRKLYAGTAGRFSTDLDFSVRSADEDLDAVLELLVEAIAGAEWGPFRYGTSERRGKPYVTISSDLGDVETLTCKLDVNPPPWLPTELRPWVPMPVHEHYGGPLPELRVIQIEENVAEKIARLNRTTTARDAYDLVWIMQKRRLLNRGLDLDRIRRLAVLKIWVDASGLTIPKHAWKAAHEPQPLDVENWLRERGGGEFDDENIGLLATPPPELDQLGQSLSQEYAFLRELDPDEKTLAACNGRDRSLALRLLSELPESLLPEGSCW